MPLSAAPRRPRCGIWATGLSGCTSLTVVAPGTSRPSTLEASHRGSRRSSGEDQNDLPGSPPWAEDHVVARVPTRPRKEPSTGRLGTAATTGTSARTSSATTSCSSSRGEWRHQCLALLRLVDWESPEGTSAATWRQQVEAAFSDRGPRSTHSRRTSKDGPRYVGIRGAGWLERCRASLAAPLCF